MKQIEIGPDDPLQIKEILLELIRTQKDFSIYYRERNNGKATLTVHVGKATET